MEGAVHVSIRACWLQTQSWSGGATWGRSSRSWRCRRTSSCCASPPPGARTRVWCCTLMKPPFGLCLTFENHDLCLFHCTVNGKITQPIDQKPDVFFQERTVSQAPTAGSIHVRCVSLQQWVAELVQCASLGTFQELLVCHAALHQASAFDDESPAGHRPFPRLSPPMRALAAGRAFRRQKCWNRRASPRTSSWSIGSSTALATQCRPLASRCSDPRWCDPKRAGPFMQRWGVHGMTND